MALNNPLTYHEEELRIARSPNDLRRIMPPALPSDSRVLDIGCGAGQTLLAAYPDRLSFGLDLDIDALRLGRTWSDRISFAGGTAESLPYAAAWFDIVIARVCLPLTDLGRSLAEAERVLRPGGRLWITLHDISIPLAAAKRGNLNSWIFFGYIVVNSLLFHFCQRLFHLPGKGYESFQTNYGMKRALQKLGFEDISIDRTPPHFLLTAVKPAAGVRQMN